MPSNWTSRSADYLAPRPGQADAWTAAAPGRTSQRLARTGPTTAPNLIADALGLAPDSSVFVRERIIQLDGETTEIAASYYPPNVAADTALAGARKIRGGAVTELARLGYQPDRTTEDIDLRPATDAESSVLDIPLGTNVLALLRTHHANDGTRYEASLMVMKGPRRLHYEMEVRP